VNSSARHRRADLWVDRYRPQRFVDLAGDERVNRETLAWVKEWDQCVFGTRKRNLKRKREDEPPVEQGGRTDQWGRPREKVLFEYGEEWEPLVNLR
jgi:chromosome transmission fidelity protein 18